MRCAKFGVVVLQTCMLNWGVSSCHGYMCIVLYISASRSAKFGAVVCKASMLNWRGVNLP